MFDHTLKLLLKRLALILGLYMILRLAFYIFNYNAFAEATAVETLWAFFIGLRFDLAAIAAINAPFILLSLLPWGNLSVKGYQRFLKYWFILTNAPFIALALVDIEFFKFIGKRSSNEITGITGDIANQITQLMQYYWYIILAFIVLVWLLIKLYPQQTSVSAFTGKSWVKAIRLVMFAGLAVISIRGGFQLKPLRVSHAFVLEPASLGHLSLNSPFTFIKGIGKPQLEQKKYFQDQKSLVAAMAFKPDLYVDFSKEPLKENVVIIILESFAAEYVGALNNGQGYTPFLDSLSTQGVLIKNAFANGRKSIEALPSILAGIPSLMQEPYITSAYQANKIYGLGSVLQDAGYRTAFFHGAANGTMGFNNFAKLAGIDEYYGLDEYPKQLRDKDYDGQWGIFDEPYMQYVAGKLSEFNKPFFTTIFSLSSHHPYTIPAKYKGKFPKGNLEIHESIGYADHALQKFFQTASKQSWFKNTLFIITADHTQKSSNTAYQDEIGPYRVPLIIYHPGKNLESVNSEIIAQHVDVFPTVVDYLNISTDKILPFGNSLFNPDNTGKAILYDGSSYLFVEGNTVTSLGQNDVLKFYDLQKPPLSNTKTLQSGNKLKAYVQYYQQGLINNNFYFWKNK